ncbi:murein biosynthesis integral membrane protein MurJ [Frankia sp. AgB32]|uniref:murein biosynthesis integral membrane protein MurJ n=1 Tax=Frankia sp. AgB32 TaxID=631119 RepID=UPI00200FB5DB|nr:murein biosynthesis integral membrane protein MurJ [Frankia sp. AgB32]MCK9893287.1 murein biosynthesis integral membrane protein MurJ [Frankia sp. AgB32]
MPRGARPGRARTGGQAAPARGAGRSADAPPTAAIAASPQRARTAATTRRGKAKPAKSGPSLGQASGIMAIGTIASRASGFLRTVAIAAAIGTGAVGDAYNVANTTPNIIYDLLLGGILTSVVVPVMVRAAKEDPDGGDRFASSLLTLMILGLGVATAIGMVAAPWITNAYLDAGPQEQALATDLLRWFLPQIVFYGVGATIGAILNVRQSFAAPMFAPILNNVLVIATCVAFIYVVSGPRPPGVDGAKAITHAQTTVLAGGTTLGVVAMTVALLPALRRVGFRYRPTLDLRHPELRSAARLAGWTLLFVVVSQAGYLVIVNLSTASTAYTIYTYGYQIFQLPYAIIGVSVITALLPRMSGHAAQGRNDLVRADISTATRVAATAIVPAALFLLALGRPIAVAVFHHGAVNYHDAIDIGDTLSAFALALVPFSLFQVQLRAFYAYQDSRTPALVNMCVVAVNVLGAVVLTVTVPERHRAPALALAFAAAYLVGLAAATTLLRRRLGGVDGNRTGRVITQVAIAAGLGAVVASLVARAIRALAGTGWLISGIAVVVACTAGGALFLAAAVRMQIHEVSALLAAVNGRLGRGQRGGGSRPAPKPSGGTTPAGGARAADPDRAGGSTRGDRNPGTAQVGQRQRPGLGSRAARPDRTERLDRGDRGDRGDRAQGRNRNGPPPRSGRPDPRRGDDGPSRRGRPG